MWKANRIQQTGHLRTPLKALNHTYTTGVYYWKFWLTVMFIIKLLQATS